MLRRTVRDSAYDPQLRINTKLSLQRKQILSSVWILSVAIMTVLLTFSPGMKLKYWLSIA